MTKKFLMAAAVALAALVPQKALAQDADLISAGIGYYDILDDDGAVDFRLEYRPYTPIFIDEFRPWLGAELTSDLSVWIGGGFLLDLQLAENVYLTPSFGAGFYDEGDSDKDLGYPLEFRSQIEAAYELDNQSRIGIAFGHLSNASLDDDNPGTEVLNLYYHMPY